MQRRLVSLAEALSLDPSSSNIDYNNFDLSSRIEVLSAMQDFNGLIFAALGVFLTFIAFYIQYVFNQRQKDDLSRERAENQFFHLLETLRDIRKETKLKNIGDGKIVFHYMFYEFKAIYFIIDNYFLERGRKDVTPEYICTLAFAFFIDGVSPDSSKNSGLMDTPLTEDDNKAIFSLLLDLQQQHKKVRYLADYHSTDIAFFDGHRIRLLPYFNYVGMIVRFIAQNSAHFSPTSLSYLYSEMTEHELGLLYAYKNYAERLGMLTPTDHENSVYTKVFCSLPKTNADRFKFNTATFITRHTHTSNTAH